MAHHHLPFFIKITMKFAIALTIISLVQSAAIPSDSVQAAASINDSNLEDATEKAEMIPEMIPDWLVQFKDFMDSDELDFNFESYFNNLDDEQTDELFYLIMLMSEASKNA